MSKLDVELLTTRQASELLDESVRQTIRRVERGHLIPAKKLPGLRGSYLFDRADIEDLASSPVVPVSSAGASGESSVAPERKAS